MHFIFNMKYLFIFFFSVFKINLGYASLCENLFQGQSPEIKKTVLILVRHG